MSLLIFLFACSNSGSTTLIVEKNIDTTNDERSEDTSIPEENEPDPEDSAVAEEEEEPIVFGENWAGVRNISFETCSATLEETGNVLLDPVLREELENLCSSCSEIYQVTVSPPFICEDQVAIATTVWRGVVLRSDHSLGLYNFSPTNQGYVINEIAIAEQIEDHWEYQYESTFQSFSYFVDGVVSFPNE